MIPTYTWRCLNCGGEARLDNLPIPSESRHEHYCRFASTVTVLEGPKGGDGKEGAPIIRVTPA